MELFTPEFGLGILDVRCPSSSFLPSCESLLGPILSVVLDERAELIDKGV